MGVMLALCIAGVWRINAWRQSLLSGETPEGAPSHTPKTAESRTESVNRHAVAEDGVR